MHLRDIRDLRVPAYECKCYVFDVFRAYQNSAKFPFFTPPPLPPPHSFSRSLLYELVYKRLCRTPHGSFLPISLLRDSFRCESFFPIKYSLRIACVSCFARLAENFSRRSVIMTTSRAPTHSFLTERGYNGYLAPRSNLFVYERHFG